MGQTINGHNEKAEAFLENHRRSDEDGYGDPDQRQKRIYATEYCGNSVA